MPTKKSKKQFDKTKGILFGIIIGLTVIVVSLLVTQAQGTNASGVTIRPQVGLGAMQYDFKDGKAVKRSDETVNSLKAFLEAEVKKSDPKKCDAVYNVILASSDEKQVLLDYGCEFPGARMFAVNENGAWRTVSPTNHFDMFGIPECDYVNTNHIDKALAPVCVHWGDEDTPMTYSVRE